MMPNKVEIAWLISHLRKAIYNLERAKAFDDNVVSQETINQLKENVIYYQVKLKETKDNE